MHRRSIDTPPAEMRQLVPKLTRSIEEVERLRAEATAALAALDEAKGAVRGAEEADRQALADHARGKLKQEPKPTASRRGAGSAVRRSRRFGPTLRSSHEGFRGTPAGNPAA